MGERSWPDGLLDRRKTVALRSPAERKGRALLGGNPFEMERKMKKIGDNFTDVIKILVRRILR